MEPARANSRYRQHEFAVVVGIRGLAELVGLGVTALVTIYVSRVVGPVHLGFYAVMMAVFQLGVVLVNAGLPTVASQRVATGAGNPQVAWWTVSLARLVIAIGLVTSVEFLIAVSSINDELRWFLSIGLLALLSQAFRTDWLLVAHGLVGYVSLLRVIGVVATAALALLLVRSEQDASVLPLLLVVPATVVAIVGCLIAAARDLVGLRPARAQLIQSLRVSLVPMRDYILADLSVYLYTSSDRLILYAFANATIVGLYDAAYRLIQPFYGIASAVSDALFRKMAATRQEGAEAPVMRRYVDLMCVATIPIGFFTSVFAPLVIHVVYGARFADSAQFLAVLGWVITFGFVSGVSAFPFTTWNLSSFYSRTVLAGSITNGLLNLALIPTLLGFGAALASVGGKCSASVVGMFYFRRASNYPLLRDVVIFALLSACALTVALAARWGVGLRDDLAAAVFVAAYVVAVGVVRFRRYLAPRRAPGGTVNGHMGEDVENALVP